MKTIKRGTTGRVSKHEASFKRKAIAELLSGTITKTDLARKYGTTSTSLARWLLWYEKDQQQFLPSTQMKEADKGTDDRSVVEEPEELKALREALRLATIKLACLETLIDVTEQELGIDIRKKGGTRSSVA